MTITIDEKLLIAAFDALEGELHHPEQDSDCDACKVMWDIEQAVGRQLTDDRGGHGIAEISGGGRRITFKP